MNELKSNQKVRTRVVAIDDHLAINELIASLVNSIRGCRMLGWAQTEADALALCLREQPDVIIMDLIMPRCSGILLMQKLRAVCAGAHIMIFSGNLTLEKIQQALAGGALGIVGKMASLEEFRRALVAVSEGRTFFSKEVSALIKELVVHHGRLSIAEGAALSDREKEVLEYLAQGFSSRQIAAQLGVSVHTVANHRSRLMKKTGLHRTAQLSVYAADLGLVKGHVGSANDVMFHESPPV